VGLQKHIKMQQSTSKCSESTQKCIKNTSNSIKNRARHIKHTQKCIKFTPNCIKPTRTDIRNHQKTPKIHQMSSKVVKNTHNSIILPSSPRKSGRPGQAKGGRSRFWRAGGSPDHPGPENLDAGRRNGVGGQKMQKSPKNSW